LVKGTGNARAYRFFLDFRKVRYDIEHCKGRTLRDRENSRINACFNRPKATRSDYPTIGVAATHFRLSVCEGVV
jgi:hypothetical protein